MLVWLCKGCVRTGIELCEAEKSEMCLDWERDRRWKNQSWKNQSKIVEESGKGSMSVVAEKKTVPRCLLQLVLEVRLYAPSTKRESDEFLKYRVSKKRSK